MRLAFATAALSAAFAAAALAALAIWIATVVLDSPEPWSLAPVVIGLVAVVFGVATYLAEPVAHRGAVARKGAIAEPGPLRERRSTAAMDVSRRLFGFWPRPPTFDEAARAALTTADAEARRLHHGWVGTEHLALALVADELGEAGTILRDLGVEAAALDARLGAIIGPGEGGSDDRRLTPRAKRVIEHAVDEVRRLGHAEIGTGHLLLGLINEPEGIGAHLLEHAGVDPELLHRHVLGVLAPHRGE